MVRRPASASIVALALLCSPLARAAVLEVPAEYPTIQAAIDAAAASGDLVLVAPGTYYEHLSISGKSVDVVSTGGAAVTILDGQGTRRLVTWIGSDVLAGGTIRGFTLRNGQEGVGGAAYAFRARGVLEQCHLHDNHAYNGGATYAVWGASILVVDSVVENNTAFYDGGAGYGVVGWASFERSVLRNNTAGRAGGAVVGAGFCGSGYILESVVTGNTAGEVGGALYTAGTTSCNPAARAVNSLFVGNSAPRGGAIASEFAGRAWLANNTIVGNVAEAGGGFWALEGSYHLILNTIFWGNATPPVFSLTTQWGIPNGLAGSDIEGGVPTGFEGDGTNISADPLFVDPANGDYRLGPGSPCIDAGVPSVSWLAAPAYDLLGAPRPYGDGFDIGAYEASLAQITAVVDLDPNTLNVCNANGWLTAYLTLPEGYDPSKVVVPLTLIDGAIPAIRGELQGGVLALKFDRENVVEYLRPGGDRIVELTVTGEVEGVARFTAKDRIRAVAPCDR